MGSVGSKFALHVMGWVGLGVIGWVALGCAVSQLYCLERLIQSDVKITALCIARQPALSLLPIYYYYLFADSLDFLAECYSYLHA